MSSNGLFAYKVRCQLLHFSIEALFMKKEQMVEAVGRYLEDQEITLEDLDESLGISEENLKRWEIDPSTFLPVLKEAQIRRYDKEFAKRLQEEGKMVVSKSDVEKEKEKEKETEKESDKATDSDAAKKKPGRREERGNMEESGGRKRETGKESQEGSSSTSNGVSEARPRTKASKGVQRMEGIEAERNTGRKRTREEVDISDDSDEEQQVVVQKETPFTNDEVLRALAGEWSDKNAEEKAKKVFPKERFKHADKGINIEYAHLMKWCRKLHGIDDPRVASVLEDVTQRATVIKTGLTYGWDVASHLPKTDQAENYYNAKEKSVIQAKKKAKILQKKYPNTYQEKSQSGDGVFGRGGWKAGTTSGGNNSPAKNKNNNNGNRTGKKQVTCYHCKETGHYQNKCPSRFKAEKAGNQNGKSQ